MIATKQVQAETHQSPRHGGPGDLLQMQQVIGNRRVQRAAEAARTSLEGSSRGAGKGLPGPLRANIEGMSGESMADVRVHYDSPGPAKLDALAFTRGSEIHVGPGQERHLAHEAWHVVQQKQGRVRSTTQAGGHAVNDDVGLEREADVMGARVASERRGTAAPGRAPQARGGGGGSVLQLLSKTREIGDDRVVKLETTAHSRGWKLALYEEKGKGAKLSEIYFKLETKFAGAPPKLSIDTMSSKDKTSGAGTELLKHVPWAVSKIIRHNKVATRFGSLQFHSGFMNVIAFQLAAKKYAETMGLRYTSAWMDAKAAARTALPHEGRVGEDRNKQGREDHDNTADGYDLKRFPDFWADIQVLRQSDLFEVSSRAIDVVDVKKAVDTFVKLTGKRLFTMFDSTIDVKDVSALNTRAQTVKAEAEAAKKLLGW